MCVCCLVSVDEGTPQQYLHSSQLFLVVATSLPAFVPRHQLLLDCVVSIPKLPQQQPRKAKLKARPVAASACLYCVGGQLLQATLSGPCRACLVSHPCQLVPYAALGLGRDGANNLASSRLESWALDDSSVEKTPYSVLDCTKRPHKYRDIE